MTPLTTALRLALLAVLACPGLVAAVAAQETPAPAASGAAQGPVAEASLPPVEAPPALSAVEAEKLKRSIKKLRNDSEKHRRLAEQEVIAFGRGAIPLLEDAATTKDEAMMIGLANCLCGVADARDRDRVQADLTSPLPALRRFAAREAGEIRSAALLDLLPGLLGDEDESTRVEAALSLISNGREEGLAVATLAFGGTYTQDWSERVLAALPGVADAGPHTPVARLLDIDPTREKTDPDGASKERLAAVKLLHAIADKAALRLLVRALDDRHNVVQREAINALRDLLEDKGPLEASSIFQQLNEVNRLKELAVEKV